MLLIQAAQLGISNGFSGNAWVTTEVTSLLNADGTVSVALVGVDQQAINLAAREAGSHAPQLLVEVSSPSNPTATRTSAPSALQPVHPHHLLRPNLVYRPQLRPTHPDRLPPNQVTSNRDSPSGQHFIIPGSRKPGTSRGSILLPITHPALGTMIPAPCPSSRRTSAP